MATTLPTFEQLMKGFGVVTVMNAKLYKLGVDSEGNQKRYAGSRGVGADRVITANDFAESTVYLDTLKIANLTQEGPTKTITGGQYANPLIKYGKTMTCEMQDALGTADVLVEFMGAKYDKDKNYISITDKFPGPFAIEGETFFIDQVTGEKVPVYIFIPQFLPDGIFNLTQDAEGDATVFDLNGTVAVTTIADAEATDGKDPAGLRNIFYEIRYESFFKGATFAKTE